MAIRFFDMFAGIGGFRSGLEAVGGFECVGHCEIDKYANQAYNAIYEPKGELFFEDARTINPNGLPDIDLICAGFPCQSFSVAGRRLGFADTRGTLFFEIARIAEAKRPAYLLMENVPGLLSHDGGRTFETILSALVKLGYDLEWCVHNSAHFGVPQQRRRLYIVAGLRGRGTGEIFSLACGNAENLKELIPGPQGSRVYETDGVACTQCAGSGGWGGKTGLYFIDMNVNPIITDSRKNHAGAWTDAAGILQRLQSRRKKRLCVYQHSRFQHGTVGKAEASESLLCGKGILERRKCQHICANVPMRHGIQIYDRLLPHPGNIQNLSGQHAGYRQYA